MGVGRHSPAGHASRSSEGKLSLDAEQALPSVSDGEATSHRFPGAGRPPQVTGAGRPRAARTLATAGGGYPIVNYEYAILSTGQPSVIRANDLKALLNWILTAGSSSMYLGQGGSSRCCRRWHPSRMRWLRRSAAEHG